MSFFKYNKDDKSPYKITIINCGEESDTLTLNNDYCRRVTVEVTETTNNQYLREIILV